MSLDFTAMILTILDEHYLRYSDTISYGMMSLDFTPMILTILDEHLGGILIRYLMV